MTSFLLSSLLLVVLVAGGIVLIVALRSQCRDGATDRGDWKDAWEQSLAGYRNLRDQGVLSDAEYRRIRTLVEPHVRSDSSPEV